MDKKMKNLMNAHFQIHVKKFLSLKKLLVDKKKILLEVVEVEMKKILMNAHVELVVMLSIQKTNLKVLEFLI